MSEIREIAMGEFFLVPIMVKHALRNALQLGHRNKHCKKNGTDSTPGNKGHCCPECRLWKTGFSYGISAEIKRNNGPRGSHL